MNPYENAKGKSRSIKFKSGSKEGILPENKESNSTLE